MNLLIKLKINDMNVFKSFCLSVIFLSFFGLSCSEGANSHKTDEAIDTSAIIKIMTYNIQHGAPIHKYEAEIEGIAAVINDYKPDLVALQEVDSVTARVSFDEAKRLGELTGMYYFFAKAIDYKGGGYGNAILSRYPIIVAKQYPLPHPNSSGEKRSMAAITVEVASGRTIQFASTHLDLKKENRLKQVDSILRISERSAFPFILAGDFNAAPQSESISKLKEGFNFPCTQNCPLTFPSDKPDRTIDYIIMNNAAYQSFKSVKYSAIREVWASDHLPLIQEVKLR